MIRTAAFTVTEMQASARRPRAYSACISEASTLSGPATPSIAESPVKAFFSRTSQGLSSPRQVHSCRAGSARRLSWLEVAHSSIKEPISGRSAVHEDVSPPDSGMNATLLPQGATEEDPDISVHIRACTDVPDASLLYGPAGVESGPERRREAAREIEPAGGPEAACEPCYDARSACEGQPVRVGESVCGATPASCGAAASAAEPSCDAEPLPVQAEPALEINLSCRTQPSCDVQLAYAAVPAWEANPVCNETTAHRPEPTCDGKPVSEETVICEAQSACEARSTCEATPACEDAGHKDQAAEARSPEPIAALPPSGGSLPAGAAGVVGLVNPRFCCYQNAIVQCLLAVPSLVRTVREGVIDVILEAGFSVDGEEGVAVTKAVQAIMSEMMDRRAGDGHAPATLGGLRTAVRPVSPQA